MDKREETTGVLSGTVLTNSSASDRPATDFYPTPSDVTQALLNYMKFPETTRFWEPACGQGHMSKVLIENGFNVTSTDLYDFSYGTGGIDFLDCANDTTDANFIITNPPFNVSEKFIEVCASLNCIDGFALLLKSQYWHGKKRSGLFEKYRPTYVLPLTWRPDFLFGKKGGAPTMECIWTVWKTPYPKYTIYDLLKR